MSTNGAAPEHLGLVYLSGPMSGMPDFNFPAFQEAADRLRLHGYDVLSPHEVDADTSKPWDVYLRQDIREMMNCKAIAVLPGWQGSRGASLEVYIARALDMPVINAMTLEPWSESILEEAQRLVGGARQGDYGHPADDFARTGRMWAAILGVDSVTPKQVALCMVAVKLSREVNKPKRDNRVDGAGYLLCADMIEERST